jgi:hypothetical protein
MWRFGQASWVLTAAGLRTAVACRRAHYHGLPGSDTLVWAGLSAAFFLLSLMKTARGLGLLRGDFLRGIFKQRGWYEDRRSLQFTEASPSQSWSWSWSSGACCGLGTGAIASPSALRARPSASGLFASFLRTRSTHGTRARPGHGRPSTSSPLLGIGGGHRPALPAERFLRVRDIGPDRRAIILHVGARLRQLLINGGRRSGAWSTLCVRC